MSYIYIKVAKHFTTQLNRIRFKYLSVLTNCGDNIIYSEKFWFTESIQAFVKLDFLILY